MPVTSVKKRAATSRDDEDFEPEVKKPKNASAKASSAAKRSASSRNGHVSDSEEDYASTSKAKSAKGGKKASSSSSKKASSSSKASPALGVKALTKWPLEFTNNGEMLWGQLHCLHVGFNSGGRVDTKKGPSRLPPGGTILQSSFVHRVVCPSGKWLVERAFFGKSHVAYMIRHEMQSAKDIFSKAKKKGIDHSGPDGSTVYVNRYDWGYHGGIDGAEYIDQVFDGRPLNDAFEEGDHNDPREAFRCQRLMMIHPDYYEALLRAIEAGKVKINKNQVFSDPASGEIIGFQLSDSDIEYELAWMQFNEGKSSRPDKLDELVGFVYDHTYSALEDFGAPGTDILIEREVVGHIGDGNGRDDEDDDDEDYEG